MNCYGYFQRYMLTTAEYHGEADTIPTDGIPTVHSQDDAIHLRLSNR